MIGHRIHPANTASTSPLQKSCGDLTLAQPPKNGGQEGVKSETACDPDGDSEGGPLSSPSPLRCVLRTNAIGESTRHPVERHSGSQRAKPGPLCSNCHTRADTENWGESYLRRYKQNPCALERHRMPPMSLEQKAMVDLVLACHPDSLNDLARLRLVSMIAAYVGVQVGELRVVSVVPANSCRVKLEMPPLAAKALIAGFQSHDPRLLAFLEEFGGSDGLLMIEALVDSHTDEVASIVTLNSIDQDTRDANPPTSQEKSLSDRAKPFDNGTRHPSIIDGSFNVGRRVQHPHEGIGEVTSDIIDGFVSVMFHGVEKVVAVALLVALKNQQLTPNDGDQRKTDFGNKIARTSTLAGREPKYVLVLGESILLASGHNRSDALCTSLAAAGYSVAHFDSSGLGDKIRDPTYAVTEVLQLCAGKWQKHIDLTIDIVLDLEWFGNMDFGMLLLKQLKDSPLITIGVTRR